MKIRGIFAFFTALVMAVILSSMASASQNVTFVSQYPSDLNVTNVLGPGGINITYNISTNDVNYTTIFLYYKSNSTQNDILYYRNGSAYSGFQQRVYSENATSGTGYKNFLWRLYDNHVLPGSYNFDERTVETTEHQNSSLTVNTHLVSVQLLNITNATRYNFFEIMINRSNGGGSLRVYYCNSSYSFSGTITGSANCALFYTLTTNTYHHSHSSYSRHMLIPFAINLTTGRINDVVVTGTSYFVVRGQSSSTWDFYYIANSSRENASRTSINTGSTWTSQTYTVDSHAHQFGASHTLWYYACANSTLSEQNCTSLRQDMFDLVGLPPTSPGVSSPAQSVYKGNITVNYTASLSPNGFAIGYYNISLLNSDTGFNRTLQTNNSLNLSLLWDSSSIQSGEFVVKVEACDNTSQCSYGTSENFTIDNVNPGITISSPQNNTNLTDSGSDVIYSVSDSSVQTCWYSNDSYSGNITLAGCANITDVVWSQGEHKVTIWVNDSAGGINRSSVSFFVDSIAPSVTLNAPSDALSSTNTSYNFSFSVNDTNSMGNCSLIFNSVPINSLSSPAKNTNLSFYNSSFATGSHTWKISCIDFYGNSGNSSQRSLTITSAATEEEEEEGGGGGTSSFYRLSSQNLGIGQEFKRVLLRNWRMSFKFNNTEHLLILEQIIDKNSVEISVASERQYANLFVGGEKKFDITGDSYYDILVRLESITGSTATFTLRVINESYAAEEQKAEAAPAAECGKIFENKSWILKTIALVVAILVAVRVAFAIRGRNRRAPHLR